MKTKAIHRAFLLVSMAMIFSGGLFSCQTAETPKAKQSAPQKAAQQSAAKTIAPADTAKSNEAQRKLVVYYLHTTFRCQSCNTIERLTREAVEQGFVQEIKNGRVELKVINVEEKGNEHFVQDYKLYTKSVILSDMRGGKEAKWKNLEQIWTLLGSQQKFVEYIQKEVKTYLEG